MAGVLGWANASLPPHFTLIREGTLLASGADALIVTYIKQALATGGTVALIIADKPYEHYNSIAKKLVRLYSLLSTCPSLAFLIIRHTYFLHPLISDKTLSILISSVPFPRSRVFSSIRNVSQGTFMLLIVQSVPIRIFSKNTFCLLPRLQLLQRHLPRRVSQTFPPSLSKLHLFTHDYLRFLHQTALAFI